MGNIISTELLKIKRYSVVKAGLVMMSLSVLMSCFYSTASTNKVWDFQYFIQQVIISNCTLFFPIIITLVAVYIIEYSCAMKSHFRKFGNQMSGSGNHLCNYASLLA